MQTKGYALQAQGLVRDFNGFRAVGGANGVDLRVRTGSIHALIGPNGAGKTTCFNLLTRFIEPSAGRILFEDRDITRLAADAVARLGLVRSFQISAVFAQLSVFENVRLALQRKRGHSFDWWRSDAVLRTHDAAAHALLDEVGLGDWSQHLAGELPYGRKRALELATTLALEPHMLLLDEPMAGMGAEDIEQATRLIRSAARGRTILMVEHNLSVVANLCDHITVLAHGEVLAEGDYATVASDARVAQAYLGKAAHARKAGARMSELLLDIRGLQAWYGPSQALHGIDLEVRRGEIVTLLGRNGVGKSTLLKSVMGIVPQRTGSIRLAGRELVSLAPHEIGRAGVAFCPDDRGIYASLTVRENLLLPPVVAPGGMTEAELMALFPNLAARAKSAGTQLSGGEQQMLAIARILRTGARLLLLDEPTEGLAPVIVDRIGELLLQLKSRGHTIVLVEQNVHFAAELADRHYLIEAGRVAQTFDRAALASDFDGVAARLGV